MSRRRLVRYGGLAAMLGGVLFALVFAAAISIYAASSRTVDDAFVGTHAIIPMLDVPVFALLAVGVLGLYLRQFDRFGRSGKAGFYLTFGGFGLSVLGGIGAIVAGIAPGEEGAPGILDIVTHPLAMLPYIAGSIIFGIVTFRANVLPRDGALLLVFGAPFWCVNVLFLSDSFAGSAAWFLMLPAVVFAVGWTWLGLGVLSEKSDLSPVEQPGEEVQPQVR